MTQKKTRKPNPTRLKTRMVTTDLLFTCGNEEVCVLPCLHMVTQALLVVVLTPLAWLSVTAMCSAFFMASVAVRILLELVRGETDDLRFSVPNDPYFGQRRTHQLLLRKDGQLDFCSCCGVFICRPAAGPHTREEYLQVFA